MELRVTKKSVRKSGQKVDLFVDRNAQDKLTLKKFPVVLGSINGSVYLAGFSRHMLSSAYERIIAVISAREKTKGGLTNTNAEFYYFIPY